MKKIILFFLIIVSSVYLFAEKIRVGVLNGPSCIPAAYLMENKSETIDFNTYADVQALLPKMIKNEVDIGFMPANVAAKVYNSSNKAIVCCAITGNGNIVLLSNLVSGDNIRDVKNRVVYVAGQGATPDYMFRYLLKKNNLNPEQDLKLDYSIPTAQLAANLISNKINYVVLPEPFATIAKSKDSKIRTVVDFQQEYEDLEGAGKTYPLTVMVATADFAKAHPDLLNSFLDDYKSSFEWTLNNPQTAGQYTEEHNLGLAKGIVAKAIPSSNYTFITSKQMKQDVEDLLNIFLNFDSKSIGGKLPDKNFYYEKKNN